MSRVGAGDPGVQFEALSSTKNKVDEVREQVIHKDRKGKEKQTEKQPERVKVFSECFLFRSFYLKLWKT